MAKTNAKTPTAPQSSNKSRKRKFMSRKDANLLLIESELALQAAEKQLQSARDLCARAGLSIDSTLAIPRMIDNSMISLNMAKLAADGATTGGHSNTDHVVVRTGDKTKDRIAELKRNLLRRHRAMQPENRGEDRWDKPRIPGERRRRIVREKDLPEAPPEPPKTGFVVFVGQMTTKIRHDRPDVPHDQTRVVSEISKIWKLGMGDDDRAYYNTFANEATKEYNRQLTEYRATGTYTPSTRFCKLEGSNIWVRHVGDDSIKSISLEEEIRSYPSCSFPKRPAALDEAYERREERSVLKRKLKVKGLLNEDGTLKDGLDFEELLQKEREKKEGTKQPNETTNE